MIIGEFYDEVLILKLLPFAFCKCIIKKQPAFHLKIAAFGANYSLNARQGKLIWAAENINMLDLLKKEQMYVSGYNGHDWFCSKV